MSPIWEREMLLQVPLGNLQWILFRSVSATTHCEVLQLSIVIDWKEVFESASLWLVRGGLKWAEQLFGGDWGQGHQESLKSSWYQHGGYRRLFTGALTVWSWRASPVFPYQFHLTVSSLAYHSLSWACRVGWGWTCFWGVALIKAA